MDLKLIQEDVVFDSIDAYLLLEILEQREKIMSKTNLISQDIMFEELEQELFGK